jgi:hypothetical protein
MLHEWQGIEKLEGTYPFTLDRSVKAYRLNSFLHNLIKRDFRERFLSTRSHCSRNTVCPRKNATCCAAATGGR